MIATPDLPNAPMNQWIAFMNLFDFYMHYVPAEKHKVPDGLSRRPRAEDDSEEEDPEEVLDKFVGAIKIDDERYFIHSKMLLMTHRTIPLAPYATYQSTKRLSDVTFMTTTDAYQMDVPTDVEPGMIRYEPNTLHLVSMLRFTDEFSYTGKEFMVRKVEQRKTFICRLGDEELELELSLFAPAYGSKYDEMVTDTSSYIFQPCNTNYEHRTDDRRRYPLQGDGLPTCTIHAFRVMDDDDPQFWNDLKQYLATDEMPKNVKKSKEALRRFIRRSKRFTLYDDRLWLAEKGRPPRLVIIDKEKRRALIAEAHNDTGHRGRDTTYKLLTDRFYWPNMYDDVAYFVKSCNACQLRSRYKPRVPFAPTWNTAILRRFDLDTVHMEDGYGGKHFLLQAIEPSINWPEAHAAAKNDSKTWAKFIYEDIISRFGCIPIFVVDNGSEFRGVTEILFKQYGVTVIFTTAYHPEGNAINERSHQTLVNSIRRSCGRDSNKWPLMVHACLLSMRCTTTRVTGYSPYYLLYGRHPILAFDIADRTWDFLDWHQVKTTEELIALRAQQLVKRDKELVLALEQQKESRRKAVDDFNKKHEKYMVSNDFDIGTWVLVHETWLDCQKGNKGALRWTGPYIVHEKFNNKTYRLREIDGAIRRDTIDKHRLKIFYYRQEHQTIKTVSHTEYLITAAIGHAAISTSTVDMMSSLFGNTFVCADYPHSITIGSFLTPFNPDLSRPILIAARGAFSRHIALSNLDDRECHIANLRTSRFNPSQRTLLMKIQDSNVRLLTSWTPDYLPWY